MNSEPIAYEKGLALELRLLKLFKAKGYQVYHNVKKTGRSGAEHQIDILAEYSCPLHTSTLIVEAKSYDKPIDKDRVMKLIQIVNDVGVDRGILITTSYFTPGAIKTAEGTNVELWDREHLARLMGETEITAVEKGLPEEVRVLEKVIPPTLSHNLAEKFFIDKRAKTGFLGKKIVEEIKTLSIVYLPYYEAELETKVKEEVKSGLFSKRMVEKLVTKTVSVFGMTGALTRVDEKGIISFYEYLPHLTGEEIAVLRSIQSSRFDASKVLALGFSEGKTRKVLASLVGKNILKRIEGKPVTYKLRVQLPTHPTELKSISEVHQPHENVELKEKYISPIIEASSIVRMLESLWVGTHVKNLSTLYYPYWVCLFESEDGSKRVELLDAISGNHTLRVGGKVSEILIKTLST